MVFDILSVVAFILSSLCTVFLGSVIYGFYKKTKGTFSFGKKR